MNTDVSVDSPAPGLGRVVQTFRPSRPNLAAGAVLGVGLIAGGIIATLPAATEAADTGVTVREVLGTVSIAAGLGCLVFTGRLARFRVDLCEHGFRSRSVTGEEVVTWDELDVIEHHVQAGDGNGAHVGPHVRAVTEHGQVYRFTGNQVGDMTAFVQVLAQLTGGYDHLWQVTSEVSRRRLAAVLGVVGLFLVVMAPVLFVDLARAEQRAGGQPVRVHKVVYLLYQAGGKGAAAGGLGLIGCGFLGWGVYAYRDSVPDAPRRRKVKRAAPPAGSEPPGLPQPDASSGPIPSAASNPPAE